MMGKAAPENRPWKMTDATRQERNSLVVFWAGGQEFTFCRVHADDAQKHKNRHPHRIVLSPHLCLPRLIVIIRIHIGSLSTYK